MSEVPESYWVGQELDWDAESVPVTLMFELPFWLMVEDASVTVDVSGHAFGMQIRSGFFELFAHEVSDSGKTVLYLGPSIAYEELDPDLRAAIEEEHVPVLWRKCKTVLLVESRCNSDILEAEDEDTGPRSRAAEFYLRAFCSAHVAAVNKFIQAYRLASYDYFAYELSPWDIPVWLVRLPNRQSIRVCLLECKDWDRKPIVGGTTCQFLRPNELTDGVGLSPSAGEFELLDSMNLMERGDYSGAVRRITTAIEALVESLLRLELLKKHSPAEVEKKLYDSRNDFPGRLRQYLKLSGQTLSSSLDSELERTRILRHAIVHGGKRISYSERGEAQRSVDTGRWIFNQLEDRSDRSSVRESRIAVRSLGREALGSIYNAEITPEGVVVHSPPGFA